MSRAVINFNIARWRAWAPGLETPEQWAAWSTAPSIPPVSEALPDVSFLPAMQRRRLSHTARMAFSVAWPLAEGIDHLPMVFVSRHGETPRTFNILSDLSRSEPLSPTQFSLSVHNAVIGLWSIMRGETSEMTALAASGDGLENGVLEAAAMLNEGAEAVLLVLTEEHPPEAYASWINDVPFPYVVALLLTAGTDWQLSLAPCATDSGRPQWPHPLNLLRLLNGAVSELHHPFRSRTWAWRRRAVQPAP